MTYQLVFQFTADTPDDFDHLVALEEKLIEGLNGTAVVDGHDFGLSEFNIFILTDSPQWLSTKHTGLLLIKSCNKACVPRIANRPPRLM